jgi:hypothetical protein
MSFRTRHQLLHVIVVLPMVAIGLLAYRLITDSQQAKAEARANCMATAAASLYASESSAARADARAVAANPGLLTGAGLRSKLSAGHSPDPAGEDQGDGGLEDPSRRRRSDRDSLPASPKRPLRLGDVSPSSRLSKRPPRMCAGAQVRGRSSWFARASGR